MDASQTDHLKAYGVVFNHIKDGFAAKMATQLRGGSFLIVRGNDIVKKSLIQNVKIEQVGSAEAQEIINQVESPGTNTSVVNLETAPKIAVYTPEQALQMMLLP